MEWYEKLFWYTALGVTTYASFKIIVGIRNHIEEGNNT